MIHDSLLKYSPFSLFNGLFFSVFTCSASKVAAFQIQGGAKKGPLYLIANILKIP